MSSKCPVNDDNDPPYKLCLAALTAAVIRHIFDEKQQRKVLNTLPNRPKSSRTGCAER